jgi:hypothetical protein
MKVLVMLDNNPVHPAGCGGIQIGDTMYINSGGGWPVAYDVYALDLSVYLNQSARRISERDDKFTNSWDGRGGALPVFAGPSRQQRGDYRHIEQSQRRLGGSASDAEQGSGSDLMDVSRRNAWS